MLLTSGTRSMQRPTHIWQQPMHYRVQRVSCLYTQASTAASRDVRLNLRDSGVTQSVSKRLFQYIYVRWFICQPDSLLDVAKISNICHYPHDFMKKCCWMIQKTCDFVKYYGKLSGFTLKIMLLGISRLLGKKTRIGSNHPQSQLPLLTSNLLKRRRNRHISADFTIETCSNGLFSLSLCPCKATK
jgi:hypothetical protein